MRLLLTLLAATILAAPVQADPEPASGPAPGNLTATYDAQNGTVHLSWTPPGNGTYNYTLYRNGDLLATLGATTYEDTAPSPIDLYQLDMSNGQTKTSAFTFIATPICDPLGVSLNTHWPFISYGIRQECLPPWIPNIHFPQPINCQGRPEICG